MRGGAVTSSRPSPIPLVPQGVAFVLWVSACVGVQTMRRAADTLCAWVSLVCPAESRRDTSRPSAQALLTKDRDHL
jgi:hypothetical protein